VGPPSGGDGSAPPCRDRERRTVARIEVAKLDLDIRFVVTSLDVGSAEWIFKDE
jgi:hypothetical protein